MSLRDRSISPLPGKVDQYMAVDDRATCGGWMSLYEPEVVAHKFMGEHFEQFRPAQKINKFLARGTRCCDERKMAHALLRKLPA